MGYCNSSRSEQIHSQKECRERQNCALGNNAFVVESIEVWSRQSAGLCGVAGAAAATDPVDEQTAPEDPMEVDLTMADNFQNEPVAMLSSNELVDKLARVSLSMISKRKDPNASSLITALHGNRAPSISVHDYISRMHKYFKCSDSCLVVCLAYMDRLMQQQPEFEFNDLCIHRLLAAGLVISKKFQDDVGYSNAYYAQVCGVTVQEINSLEATLLKLINWKVAISVEEFAKYHSGLASL